jgi:signal transduction histidine kinase/FixJ family two-component response regulator
MAERLLVVDDARDIREFLTTMVFKQTRFEVFAAEDGMSGLQMALKVRPDIMIVDLQMPQLSGLELLRRLQREGMRIPAILITGFGSEQVAVEALRLGVRDYVVKPFTAQEILRAVEQALRESRLEKERNELLQKLQSSNGQLERNLRELNTIYTIGQSFSSSLDLEGVLHRVVEAAVQLTHAEEGYLMLVDATQQELYMRASKSPNTETKSLRLRVVDSLAGKVMMAREPLLISDETGWQKIKTAYLVKSLIYVPLITPKQTMGVLGVANRGKNHSFTQRDVRVLSTLANYATAAIENASLYAEAQHRAEELASALEKLQEFDKVKSEFIQNVSHELRTPLAIMYGYAQVLMEGQMGELSQTQMEALQIMFRRAQMLIGLVDDLTMILSTQTQTPFREPLDMAAVVRAAEVDFQVACRNAALSLTVSIQPNLPLIMGDSIQLRRVLDNLMGNALKFTPAGGSISLRLWREEPNLMLEVADTGMGIPADRQERIFERFYQVDGSMKRRFGGTGLGLALVKEIVEAHGGWVSVDSTVGQGSRFWVCLPINSLQPGLA